MLSPLESTRRGAGESQKFVAELLNIDPKSYANKEKGITQFKQSEMFILARHYNKPIDELFLPPNFEKHEVAQES